ncbi:hypothetical protein BJ742DRAFT_819773 [Cladochytrium replicatum]|nr:hypothetical protein BJ742DRAFT_819773 [Cladochytrium replicatum]
MLAASPVQGLEIPPLERTNSFGGGGQKLRSATPPHHFPLPTLISRVDSQSSSNETDNYLKELYVEFARVAVIVWTSLPDPERELLQPAARLWIEQWTCSVFGRFAISRVTLLHAANFFMRYLLVGKWNNKFKRFMKNSSSDEEDEMMFKRKHGTPKNNDFAASNKNGSFIGMNGQGESGWMRASGKIGVNCRFGDLLFAAVIAAEKALSQHPHTLIQWSEELTVTQAALMEGQQDLYKALRGRVSRLDPIQLGDWASQYQDIIDEALLQDKSDQRVLRPREDGFSSPPEPRSPVSPTYPLSPTSDNESGGFSPIYASHQQKRLRPTLIAAKDLGWTDGAAAQSYPSQFSNWFTELRRSSSSTDEMGRQFSAPIQPITLGTSPGSEGFRNPNPPVMLRGPSAFSKKRKPTLLPVNEDVAQLSAGGVRVTTFESASLKEGTLQFNEPVGDQFFTGKQAFRDALAHFVDSRQAPGGILSPLSPLSPTTDGGVMDDGSMSDSGYSHSGRVPPHTAAKAMESIVAEITGATESMTIDPTLVRERPLRQAIRRNSEDANHAALRLFLDPVDPLISALSPLSPRYPSLEDERGLISPSFDWDSSRTSRPVMIGMDNIINEITGYNGGKRSDSPSNLERLSSKSSEFLQFETNAIFEATLMSATEPDGSSNPLPISYTGVDPNFDLTGSEPASGSPPEGTLTKKRSGGLKPVRAYSHLSPHRRTSVYLISKTDHGLKKKCVLSQKQDETGVGDIESFSATPSAWVGLGEENARGWDAETALEPVRYLLSKVIPRLQKATPQNNNNSNDEL